MAAGTCCPRLQAAPAGPCVRGTTRRLRPFNLHLWKRCCAAAASCGDENDTKAYVDASSASLRRAAERSVTVQGATLLNKEWSSWGVLLGSRLPPASRRAQQRRQM